MIDSIIVGYNQFNMNDYTRKVRAMGLDSGAFKDYNVNYIEYENNAYYAMDILTHFFNEGRPPAKPFHVFDLMSPAILYLGTYLTRRGFSFEYINLFPNDHEKEKFRKLLTENEVLTVAITTTNYVSPEPIKEIVDFVKRYNPRAKILLGGPYVLSLATIEDDLTIQGQFKHIGVDYCVINQKGEQAFVNILKMLKEGTDPAEVDNIAYLRDGRYLFTKQSTEKVDLAENMVDYSLFPREDFNFIADVRTSVSCPFECAFCSYPVSAGKYAYLGIDKVARELDTLKDLGITTIFFIDDTFNVPKGRFKKLLRMMIEKQYGFKWHSFYRCDHGDEETVALMAEAGCEGVFLGLESGSDAMLKRMKGTATRADYLEGMGLLNQYGIASHANVIVGFPGETYDTFRETVDLIEEGKPTLFKAQLWYADPMTPVWEQREEYDIKGYAYNWSHFSMNHEIAADLIDRMILSVKNSMWSSQYGFVWGLFYCLRRGATLGNLVDFTKAFSQVIKEKLIYPHKQGISANLVESLRRSCQFDRGVAPEPADLDFYTAEAYLEAEAFWTEKFRDASPPRNIEPERDDLEQEGWGSQPIVLEKRFLENPGTIFGRNPSLAGLAGFAILLSRLSGSGDLTIALDMETREGPIQLPVRVFPDLDLRINEWIGKLEETIAEARPYETYGFALATNALRLKHASAHAPSLDAGYRYVTTTGNGEGFSALSGRYPVLGAQLKLYLVVQDTGAVPELSLYFARRCFSEVFIGQVSKFLCAILQEVAVNPDMVLGNIELERVNEHVTRFDDAGEQFNF